MFDPTRLRAESFVAEVEIHAELASTNDWAMQQARRLDLATPRLIVAERQTAGRGRGANRWWSDDGALTFSLLLDIKENLPAERWPQVSLTVGLAVCEALQMLGPGIPIGLKWPNDVQIDGRKICGILVEIPPPPLGRLVIGIGINVNNSFAAAPPEIQGIAVSLSEVAMLPFDLNDVLLCVLRRLAEHLELLAEQRLDLPRRWREQCVLTGRFVEVAMNERRIRGCCQGVDQDGALVVDTCDGVERCLAGVVRRIA